MGTRRYALRDDQWDKIKSLLPGRIESVKSSPIVGQLFKQIKLLFFSSDLFLHFRNIP